MPAYFIVNDEVTDPAGFEEYRKQVEAPAGPWYKDFGSFKICGEGEFPKTFLLKGQPAKGKAL